MTYPILLLFILVIIGVLYIHMTQIESFLTQDLTVKSTIVSKDGKFGKEINANDIELISSNKKLGKICLGNSHECLDKNNIISLFVATDINEKINYVYDSLTNGINSIQCWSKGTQNKFNKYLKQNYSAKENVYTKAQMNSQFQILPEDKVYPYTFLQAAETHMPKNTENNSYLTKRIADRRYYPIGCNEDPYLTKRGAKSLLEQIPKENESPHLTVSMAASIPEFSKYMSTLRSVQKAEQTKEDSYWESKANEDRVTRDAALKELNDKRNSILQHINNTKVVCNTTQSHEYLSKIRNYSIQSISLVNKIKIKLIHMDTNDKILEDSIQYNLNIQNNYDTAEKLFEKVSTIYLNILKYIQDLYAASSIVAMTNIETKYNKDRSDCIQYNTSLRTAESSSKQDLAKLETEYNKLYQSSIINDPSHQTTIIDKAITYVNKLYIDCNTYQFDIYFNDINKNDIEGQQIYSTITTHIDNASLTPEVITRVLETLNGLSMTLQNSYTNIVKYRKQAYKQKETIHTQLLLCKNTTDRRNIAEYIRISQLSYNRFNSLASQADTQHKESMAALQMIRQLYIYVPIRKQWILFNPYRVGYTQGYTLPYSKYSYMTFVPNNTVTRNYTIGNKKNKLTGLRCIESNPIRISKSLAGIELLNPDGSNYKKGKLGRNNPFYIRILGGENAYKICKLDTDNKVIIPSVDPGYFRDYVYYFYFQKSHSPRWYYLRSLYKDLAIIHNYNFMRPTASTPRITKNDVFLWMIV